ncbi:MAG TPA: FKBP-type peptidyl-prolyl cis-trans isomerase, partial [Candidatus Binatia bacterium]
MKKLLALFVMSGAVLAALFFLSNLARTSVSESTPAITLKPGSVIQEGSIVSMEYTLTDDTGAVLDTNAGKEPLTFIEGAGQIVKGLERELIGLKVGDQKKVHV